MTTSGSRRDRVAAARARQEAEQAAARRRERLVRAAAVIGVVLAVLAVTGVLYLRDRPDESAARPAASAVSGGGVAIGPESGVPVVDVYVDFLCPHCRELAENGGRVLPTLAREGAARVVFHPMSFIGAGSERAAAAFGCAADAGRAVEFHDTLFAHQPAAGDGFATDELVRLGQQAGLGGDFATCVTEGRYTGWTQQVDAEAQQRGVTATPAVFVGGRQLEASGGAPGGYSEQALRDAVASAGG